MSFGFVRVAAAVPKIKVADCGYNAARIIETALKADEAGTQFAVFPELSVTGYTCADLFNQQALIDEAGARLGEIIERTKKTGIVILAGMPLLAGNRLFNCAVALQGGRILGVVPKTYIPCCGEFYEKRWFAAGGEVGGGSITLCGQTAPFGVDLMFGDEKDERICFAIEICEDLWAAIPPSSYQALAGASLLFNLSASDETVGKHEYRRELVRQQSGRCVAGYVYASGGIYESTTDVVYGGHAIIAENGAILAESERFSLDGQLIISEIDVQRLTHDRMKNVSFIDNQAGRKFRIQKFCLREIKLQSLTRRVDPYPFVPSDKEKRNERCGEIFSIQTSGLAKRLMHTGVKHALIGVSGGLDSTLALLVAARTFDLLGLPRKNILALTMPGFGTSEETYGNAKRLMELMDVSVMEVDIKEACLLHFKNIGHDPDLHDEAYENAQARERTQILMDLANKRKGLVIGTGDLSELALGWCTYNGDHMSMYGVNCGVPKTLVRYLVEWVADNASDSGTRDVLHRILNTPVTPELLPPDSNGDINQKTEEIIGPYELHDFFLYHMARYGAPPQKILFLAGKAFDGKYGPDEIKKWLRVFYKRFFSQQYKRSCLPDGPKVGSVSLSPRGDWRMPSDAEAEAWLKEL